MSHMVVFRNADGKAGYRPADSLEDAARYVERLRNVEGVEDSHIYRMEEVTFEYKPYYKVEVAGAAEEPAKADKVEKAEKGDKAETAEKKDTSSLDAIPTPTPVEVEEAVNGKRGLFSR